MQDQNLTQLIMKDKEGVQDDPVRILLLVNTY